MSGYERDYVRLPAVEEGDRVRVNYVSGQNDSEQSREGEVVEVHVNGFTFVHDSADEGYGTSVRDHSRHEGGVRRRVGTVRKTDRGTWGHAADLNRRRTAPERTPVENLSADE